ncbi:AEC family transporter [Cellulomonas endophytica]|uniref:AEC family transporter n=1 Tax=Cellulomonas endophytica TaxID=2494735 RepID=UPI0010103AF5|nr:AEC family transporter [Cellulomonas endophytica]
MGAVLAALGTIGAVIALGALVARLGVLGEHAAPVLARTVFTVATPCLMVTTVAHADLAALVSRSAVVVWGSTALVAVVAALVLRLALRRDAADVTVGTLAASYVNAGNLGLPLAVYLLGTPLAVVPTLLFQLLVLAPVGFAVLDAHRARGAAAAGGVRPPSGPRALVRRTFSNPIIVATLVGLVLAALPWDLPETVYAPFALVGQAAAPVALLTFGLSLGAPRGTGAGTPRADLALVVVLRSVVHPLLAAGLARLVGLDDGETLAVVAMAALPTAQNVLVYALQYGRGQPLARDAGLVTTVLAVPVLLVVAAVLG